MEPKYDYVCFEDNEQVWFCLFKFFWFGYRLVSPVDEDFEYSYWEQMIWYVNYCGCDLKKKLGRKRNKKLFMNSFCRFKCSEDILKILEIWILEDNPNGYQNVRQFHLKDRCIFQWRRNG